MSDTDKSEQALCMALYGKTTQELDANQVIPFLDMRDKLLPLITQQCKEAFERGQRVGQYQAADKLYGHTTTMWLFKDEPSHPKAEWSERINDLVKDCEKYMNHNRKVYAKYVNYLIAQSKVTEKE
jgi:hypothetical protein